MAGRATAASRRRVLVNGIVLMAEFLEMNWAYLASGGGKVNLYKTVRVVQWWNSARLPGATRCGWWSHDMRVFSSWHVSLCANQRE